MKTSNKSEIHTVELNEAFMHYRHEAIDAIKSKDYEKGRVAIWSAFMENQEKGDVHNLLGIIAEMEGQVSRACKHFRAACALEPDYKPGMCNLERITSFHYRLGCEEPDYGE